MDDTAEYDVIEDVLRQVARAEARGIDALFHVQSGVPGEAYVDAELRISSGGLATARALSPAGSRRESAARLSHTEVLALLRELAEGAREMTPRSRARFLPDSVLGMISFRVDSREASFYFLADAEQAEQHHRPLSARAKKCIDTITRLQERLLASARGEESAR